MVILFRPGSAFTQERGDLLSDTLIYEFNRAKILEIYDYYGLPELLFPIRYDVSIHKIVYWTLDGRGDDLTLASGLVTIPIESDCYLPVLCYNHGTLEYDSAITDFNAKFQQHFAGVPISTTGYMTVIPDYLGYGATPLEHPHPFTHAKSESTAVVDMIRASKILALQKDVLLSDDLFLLGYSQGAHVTLATLRELETFHQEEFHVTAAAAGSGAYDISGMMRDSMLNSDVFSNSFFIAFIIAGYQYVYGDIYDNLQDVFIPPYDSLINKMLYRPNPESGLRYILPDIGYTMLQPEFVNSLVGDSLHPLNMALKDNDVYDWSPRSPLRLLYCEADETVPYGSSTFTEAHMNNLGATDVLSMSVGADLDHAGCIFPALLTAKFWFDSFVEDCATPIAELDTRNPIECFPNPFSTSVSLALENGLRTTIYSLAVYNVRGEKLMSTNIRGSGTVEIPLDLPCGLYLFEIAGSQGSIWKKMIKAL